MILGHDEAGSGRVLVLMHAFPLDSRMWAAQIPVLAARRRVVAVDFRGRGRSPSEASSWSIQDHAADVAETIVAAGASSADFAGISMGGYAAFALWRQRPDLVDSLILIDTKAEPDTPEGRTARDDLIDVVRARGLDAVLDPMLKRLVSPPARERLRGPFAQMLMETPPATVINDTLALRDRPDSRGDLAGISVPTLVVHGTDDETAPIRGAEEMARSIPGCTFAPIAGSGHLSPMEQPGAVNAAITGFLAALNDTR